MPPMPPICNQGACVIFTAAIGLGSAPP